MRTSTAPRRISDARLAAQAAGAITTVLMYAELLAVALKWDPKAEGYEVSRLRRTLREAGDDMAEQLADCWGRGVTPECDPEQADAALDALKAIG